MQYNIEGQAENDDLHKKIKTLRAENVRQQQRFTDYQRAIETRDEIIENLTARAEAAEKDTARLGWLINTLAFAKDPAWTVRNFIQGRSRAEVCVSIDIHIKGEAGEGE
jgi:hypothetical protein